MSDRISQDDRSFEVSGRGKEVELYIFNKDSRRPRAVMITVMDDREGTNFTITPEEATAMKNFLINQGY